MNHPHASRLIPLLSDARSPYRIWGLSLLFTLSCLLVSRLASAEENPYASHYQAQNQGNLHSLQDTPNTQLLSGVRREDDNIRMLEDGYDLMGFSNFEAEEVAPDLALEFGRSIKADNILVYVKKAGNVSAASKMEMIKEAVKKGQTLTEKDMAATPGKYHYYATFWAKLPPPVLGVHVIKLVQRQSGAAEGEHLSTPGVRVIAVIHGSVAEKSGLLRGDQLLKINQEKVEDAATLSSLVRKYRGKAVKLELERESEPMLLEAQL
ncbi:PDZ domain-containing protein [Methylophilus sp. 3sh_L]|uniref:PDZ domain-containing protein n=1 Tax=Methylophilus sp. 3sh_L TaxID=3377114 RepID=UPI00398EFCBA